MSQHKGRPKKKTRAQIKNESKVQAEAQKKEQIIRHNIKIAPTGEPHPEFYLWRYMNLKKFLSFIIDRNLFLNRLDNFQDMNEGISPSVMDIRRTLTQMEKAGAHKFENTRFKKDPEEISSNRYMGIPTKYEHNPIMELLNTYSTDRAKWDAEKQRFYYANCWFVSHDAVESAAMWSLYSDMNSVAVKIKYKDFKKIITHKGVVTNHSEDIEEISMGLVCYEHPNGETTYPLPYCKDISFRHENEFRLVAIVKETAHDLREIRINESLPADRAYNESRDYKGITIDFEDFLSYPFEIVFHPQADYSKQILIKILEQFRIPFKCSPSLLRFR
jgi:hypothetical protein